MRKKPSFTRGTLGLALAASVFFGCQDFLGEDKGEKASARARDRADQAALKDTLHNPPGKGPDTAHGNPDKPDTSKGHGKPDLAALCLQLQKEMLVHNETGDKKSLEQTITLYNAHGCPEVLKPNPPPPPPDTLSDCEHVKSMLATLPPDSPKYAPLKEYYAAHCLVAPPTPVPGTVEECKYLVSEMHTATGQYAIDLKDKYIAKSCDKVLAGAQPPVPPDTVKPIDPVVICTNLQANMLLFNETGDKAALEKTIILYNENKCAEILKPVTPPPPADTLTECEHAMAVIGTLAPDSPKYLPLKEFIAAHCTDPVKPDPAPASLPTFQDSLAACKEIHSQMLSAGEPKYGELKDAFTSMGCTWIIHVPDPHAPPPPQPDHATQCKEFRDYVAQLTPDHPKYQLYKESLAIECADVP